MSSCYIKYEPGLWQGHLMLFIIHNNQYLVFIIWSWQFWLISCIPTLAALANAGGCCQARFAVVGTHVYVGDVLYMATVYNTICDEFSLKIAYGHISHSVQQRLHLLILFGTFIVFHLNNHDLKDTVKQKFVLRPLQFFLASGIFSPFQGIHNRYHARYHKMNSCFVKIFHLLWSKWCLAFLEHW